MHHPSPRPLASPEIDLDPEEFRRLGHRAIDLLVERLAGIRDAAVRQPVPEALRDAFLNAPLPTSPSSPDALLDRVATDILPYPMGNASPRFFAWVNSPPAPLGVLGDLLASGLDPSVAGGDHAGTYVEHAVLRWLKELLGLPSSAAGVLTSGGSVATIVGLAAMRHHASGGRARLDGLAGTPPMVVYTSTQGHSCIQKAVELLGIGSNNLRRVPVDREFRFDVAALRAQIARDRADGLRPVAVAASAGTVNTGAIDPLDELADLCAAEGLWLHVDGAYGGVAALDPASRPLLRGIERADSVGVDPHKWLYIPVECGCAFVRDAAVMRDAFSVVPPYLRDDTAMPWFSEFTVQQTRGFRALKLWLVLQQVGTENYGRLIARNIALSRRLQALIRERPDFELVSDGPLSITCFRYAPPQAADVDRLNREIAMLVQREGRVFLTTTELDGRPVLRACIVNFRTEAQDLDVLLETVAEAGARLLSEAVA
ncbi:MAG TPA: aspartate aminotransferase family protein [Vicinamibacterales bacterium]